ncbi:hypothetical protein, partial [Lampropedia cohaerens]|uniref:hypothetical protein n=1 Tax=Lampropedia cohaerens TaxID=1610491 RepID=UPI001E48578D
GVKLGGVRLDLDIICGDDNSRCVHNNGDLIKDGNGNYVYKGSDEYPTYQSLSADMKEAGGLYGATGGFQPIQGAWYLPGGLVIPYESGSFSDAVIESFAGTHDFLGGQIWGWYGDDGNTSRGRGTHGECWIRHYTSGGYSCFRSICIGGFDIAGCHAIDFCFGK